MRKALYALVMLIVYAASTANAAPGDTTWVSANNVQLNYYNNFDTIVVFPNATKSYRKIYMIFTLGKYACPGSPAYCGDWDYTVQSYFMAKHTSDTLELGRFITPYAHTGYGRFAANWTNRYIFDVTDYYPVLHDTGTVRIHYSGYSGGFTGNIRFAFIEGTPERNVLHIDRLWHGDFNYGHGATPINTALAALSRVALSGTYSTELKMNITGHGGDDSACAEFCPNTYDIAMNGVTMAQQPFFRSDCSANDLYPQSGTWLFSRANWCPGAQVRSFTHKLPITPLSHGAPAYPYKVAMSFPAYTSTIIKPNTSHASYTIDAAVLCYGDFNKMLDASLEDIIAPTDAEYHWRENPTSISPKFTVRNSGSTDITSIKFEYGIAGRNTKYSYTWTGTLPSLQNIDVTMPALPQLRVGAGTYGFTAAILLVNGVADDDALNNTLSSTFTPAPVWPADFEIQLRAADAHPNNPAIAQTAWRIEDMAGNVVRRQATCPVNTVCADTIHLAVGAAYRLVVTDSVEYGYFDIASGANVGVMQGDGNTNGFVRVYDLSLGLPIGMRGNFGNNFGSGYTQYFFTGSPATVAPMAASSPVLRVFPNPASNIISVLVDGMQHSAGELIIQDMLGRTMLKQLYKKGITELNASGLPNGIYQVLYVADNGQDVRLQQRVVVTH